MASAQDYIKRAMRLIGALGSGETPTSDEIADGLTAVNAMLDQWWIQRLAVYSVDETAHTWASGQQTRTIGSGGDIAATRPVRVQSAAQTISGIDYPIGILTSEQYRTIPDKTTQSSLMTSLFYDPAYPLGILYGYPVPNTAAAISLRTWTQVESFATATETVSLPPGYEQAIVYNLAVLLAPEYERAVPQLVGRTAINSLRIVKRHNVELPSMTIEPAAMTRGSTFNWHTGD